MTIKSPSDSATDREISSDAVLAVSFDDGTARDHSIKRNNGTVEGAQVVKESSARRCSFLAQQERRRQ